MSERGSTSLSGGRGREKDRREEEGRGRRPWWRMEEGDMKQEEGKKGEKEKKR